MHESFVLVGTGAGAPPIEFHVAFVPAAGEAAGPPIVSVIIMRFVLTRDGRTWRAGVQTPHGSYYFAPNPLKVALWSI